MADLILKDESNKIIGLCMEVHKAWGMGFKEGMPHSYNADFIVYNSIVL